MTPAATECSVVRRIWMDEALGRPLTSAEISLRARHVERCEACCTERDALCRLRDVDGPGPAPVLDELTRRRWVDRVIERAELAVAADASERRGSLVRTAGIAGIAAAAVFAAFAAVWFSRGDAARSIATEPIASRAEPRAAGRVLMASGEVSTSFAGAVGDGRFAVGGRLATERGIAVAALDGGVALRLERDTAVTLVRAEPALSEIRLEEGTVLVSVDPNHKGRKFRVLVGDDAVEVKGTIFEVSRGAGGPAAVSVFRGEVLVSGPDGARPVRLGERFEIGAAAVEAFGDEEKRGMEIAMDALSALDQDGAATLEVESLPRGASVSVDGVEIGATPLTAALRPGYRRLELRIEGRESVRELLRLTDGAKTSRTFDLAAAPAAPAGEAVATATQIDGAERAVPKVPSPNELLDSARDFRAAGDFSGAIAAYERLVAAYPETPVARTALVSLGQLYLDQGGNPERGLDLFRRYLASGRRGALAQEAAFGMASAQRALGDTAAERAALEAFLRDFGGSNQAPRAAARLSELR
jgi:TolA-binding protein